MKLYNGLEFITTLKKFRKCSLNLSSYFNHSYQCSCGETHTFLNVNSVICQGAWKLVLECPENKEYITCVKLKSNFFGIGFAGFESLYGTKLSKTAKDAENSLIAFHYTIQKFTGEI